jgi:glutamate/tyrosine decarboxylase-like PLP-dependent enzyme
MSPAAALLNSVALRWVAELLGLPGGTGGGFVTGATMANAACLAAARDAVLARHGWDAAGQGLAGAPAVTVVVGAEVHAAEVHATVRLGPPAGRLGARGRCLRALGGRLRGTERRRAQPVGSGA